jgi:Protein of unknown function (DUF2786)
VQTEPSSALLDRVRKLLAKAEADGVTAPEAEALTAKAAELMARYGIDRAMLAAARPDTDKPDSRIIDIANPWAQVRAHLLAGLAAALRCQCILLNPKGAGARVHIFGYSSDLERTDILYTSLLLQMAHGLIAASPPANASSVRAWRRSWLLGFAAAVVARVKAAEDRAAAAAETRQTESGGPSTALVLADRSVVIRNQMEDAYPVTRQARITYTGNGYRAGYSKGQQADIGHTRLAKRRALSRA